MAKQTFTTGQVLTAAQVNALQTNDFNQTVSAKTASYVLVAADKGTRIEFSTSGSVTCTVNTGLFDAGDTVYIQNTGAGVVTITAGTATVNTSATLAVNQYEGGVLYFVSASSAIWFEYASAATGDITGVTAGTGISGGGTSGTVTITNSMATEITAAGDIIVGTGSGTFDNLPIGTTGQVLTADTTVSPYKVKWAAASGGLPNSTSYTPTVTGMTGFQSVTTRYMTSGDLVYYFGRLVFDSGMTFSSALTLTLPATASALGGARFQGLGECFIADWSSGIDYFGTVEIPTTTTMTFNVLNASATYLTLNNGVVQGTPVTFGVNDELFFYVWYRKA